MKVSINGLAELVMFVKNNPKLLEDENFPRNLKNIYKQHILLQSGCKCLFKTRLQILQQSFSKIKITEEEKQNLKKIFINGFEMKNNDTLIITT